MQGNTEEARAQEVYLKFCSTRQEALRLDAALEGFFLGEAGSEPQAAYGLYLKRRIRPAAERLLDTAEPEKLLELERRGWFGERELDEFIRSAQAKGRETALLLLLRLKEEKYGYRDRDFSL